MLQINQKVYYVKFTGYKEFIIIDGIIRKINELSVLLEVENLQNYIEIPINSIFENENEAKQFGTNYFFSD